MAISFDTPLKTNDQSIKRVLAAGLPVLLVFVKGSPGSSLQEALERNAKRHAGEILVVLLDVRDNPETAQRYQFSQMPGLITFRDGKQVSRSDQVNEKDIEAHIAYLLGRGPRPVEKSKTSPDVQGFPKGSAAGSTSGQVGRESDSLGQPVNVSDADFDKIVMKSPIPVLVDFWAPWCGPCRMTEPILEKIARETGGKLRIAKLNVDQNPVTANRYNVRSIPTMMVVRSGKIIDQWVGALPEAMMRQRIAHLIR